MRSLRPETSLLALARGSCLVASLLVLADAAGAQPIISASPDITVALGAGDVVTSDESVAVDGQLGLVVLDDLGPLPEAADVIAYSELSGTKLIGFDTTVALSGGLTARAGEIVTWNGSNYSIFFSPTSVGLPGGVLTDAIALTGSGLLLSFDVDVALPGGLTVADEDLVYFNGANFTLAFDGSAEGLDRALDVDAVDDLGGGVFLLSFSTSGSVGGVVFDDEDVLRYAGGNWTLEFDASAADERWRAADLDAVMVPEPGALVGLIPGLLLLAALARRSGRTAARDQRRVAEGEVTRTKRRTSSRSSC
jgi:hypothetical protein